MQKNIAAESLRLTEEILADLELSRVPLQNAYMKACRLARLLGDFQRLSIFKYELSGYPSTPQGVPAEIWKLCKLAGRVYLSQSKNHKAGKDAEVKEFTYTQSIEQLMMDVDTTKARLEFGRPPQSLNISSANPNQYIHAPIRNVQLETSLVERLSDVTGKISSRRQYLYDYCLNCLMELRVSSVAEEIFEDYRDFADKRLAKLIPEELIKLESISANLSSSNSEDWANALHTCRRLLQAIADKLYPPKAGDSVDVGGKKIKIGPENYVNRLVLFCESKIETSVYSGVVGSSLAFLGDRLDAVFASVQKGSHSSVTLNEARRYVINTYIIIADITQLTENDDEQALAADEIVEVLDNMQGFEKVEV